MRRKNPTAEDPLRRRAAVDVRPRPQRGPGSIYTKADGSQKKEKNFWWPVAFAQKFSAYCAQRDLSYSDFAMWAIEKAMADEN